MNSSTLKPYKVAMIGSGSRSADHAAPYSVIDRAHLVACASPTLSHAEQFASQYGMKAYSDVTRMLEVEKPDLVHVVTQPNVRVGVLNLVSQAGVPACTVEKPIALDVEDWAALCELQAQTKTKFAVCHQFRWFPNVVRCRKAVEEGVIGRVLFAEGSAGMTITDQGTHALHYANSLNGDQAVATVYGTVTGWNEADVNHPGPENTLGLLQFENGVRMLWNVGPSAPRAGDPAVVWQHVRFAAYGERGHVKWEEFGKWEIAGMNFHESGDFGSMAEWNRNKLLAQIAFHNEVLDWMEDDAKPAGTNLSRSLHEWKAVLALYASTLVGRSIKMQAFNPKHNLTPLLKARAEERVAVSQ